MPYYMFIYIYIHMVFECNLVKLIVPLSHHSGKWQIVLSTFHYGFSSLGFDPPLCCCTKDCETSDKFIGKEKIQVQEPLKAVRKQSNGFLSVCSFFKLEQESEKGKLKGKIEMVNSYYIGTPIPAEIHRIRGRQGSLY